MIMGGIPKGRGEREKVEEIPGSHQQETQAKRGI